MRTYWNKRGQNSNKEINCSSIETFLTQMMFGSCLKKLCRQSAFHSLQSTSKSNKDQLTYKEQVRSKEQAPKKDNKTLLNHR